MHWSKFGPHNHPRVCTGLPVTRRGFWYTLLACALSLCLLQANASAQQIDARQLETEDQLFFALLATATNDPSTAQALLNRNKALITSQLWKRLVNTAEYTPKPLSVYSVALRVANQVADQRLAALTHYRIGWFQFGQGNISSARDSYLQSKSAFAAAQSKRDLIYILADLGTLYIYSSDYKQAKDNSQQSLAIAEEFNNSTAPSEWPDEYGIGTALSNLGNISKREGEYDKALDYFQRIVGVVQTDRRWKWQIQHADH
jgi:tetratricopeptide (TPR) repeat protein